MYSVQWKLSMAISGWEMGFVWFSFHRCRLRHSGCSRPKWHPCGGKVVLMWLADAECRTSVPMWCPSGVPVVWSSPSGLGLELGRGTWDLDSWAARFRVSELSDTPTLPAHRSFTNPRRTMQWHRSRRVTMLLPKKQVSGASPAGPTIWRRILLLWSLPPHPLLLLWANNQLDWHRSVAVEEANPTLPPSVPSL